MKSSISIIIMSLLSCCSCGPATADRNAASLPRCESREDLERLSGSRVLIEGTYRQDALPGGKRLQAATIVLPDGTRLIRSYRPVPAEFRFIGKRVIVIGVAHRDAGLPSMVQQVMAPHVYPESVRLAPGETPAPGEEGRMPPLPFIEGSEDAMRHEGEWVHLYGTLVSIEKRHEGPMGGAGIIRLADGTRVEAPELWFIRAKEHTGKEITLTTILFRKKGDEGTWVASTPNEICPGREPYCGMEGRKKRR